MYYCLRHSLGFLLRFSIFFTRYSCLLGFYFFCNLSVWWLKGCIELVWTHEMWRQCWLDQTSVGRICVYSIVVRPNNKNLLRQLTRKVWSELMKAGMMGKAVLINDIKRSLNQRHMTLLLHIMLCSSLAAAISLHPAWVVDHEKCIVVTCVCVSVCPRPHAHTVARTWM